MKKGGAGDGTRTRDSLAWIAVLVGLFLATVLMLVASPGKVRRVGREDQQRAGWRRYHTTFYRLKATSEAI